MNVFLITRKFPEYALLTARSWMDEQNKIWLGNRLHHAHRNAKWKENML